MRLTFTRTHPQPHGVGATAGAERADALLWAATRSAGATDVQMSATGGMTLADDAAPTDLPDLTRLLGAGFRAQLAQETPAGRDASGDPRTLRLVLDVAVEDGAAVPAAEVLQALDELVEAHRRWRNDRLGRGLWYFEEIPPRVFRTVDGKVQWNTVPPEKTYAMYPLRTNKTLDTLFGDQIEAIRRRARFFRDRSDWYAARGVPHTLGILLHGDPGCGKTSVIKALSAELRRHVFSVRLGELTSRSQLHAAFFSPLVRASRSAHPASVDGAVEYEIPTERRILVIEDADCLGGSRSVLRRREESAEGESDPADEGIRLGDVLNAIDGVLETPGRVLVMTSNRPEALDPALLRPGRMDLRIRLGRASAGCLAAICRHFRDSAAASPDAESLAHLDGMLTIAQATAFAMDTREKDELAVVRAMESEAFGPAETVRPVTGTAVSESPERTTTIGYPHEERVVPDSPLFF